MAYKYYNQNNYSDVPYPSSELPNATVKSGGCGVVSSAMIVENLTGISADPRIMAAYAMKKGARAAGGTNMDIMARAISTDYGLEFKTTNNESILLEHLKAGGMAIANVGGDRKDYVGVFSDGGHYVVAAGLTDDKRVIVLDPGYYSGKFSKAGRVGKVKVSGNYCICDITVLAQDTASKAPAYWLFLKRGDGADMKIGLDLPDVKVNLKGKPIEKAVILNVDGKDTTYIPAVALKDAGFTVTWDANTKTVNIG